jgi:cation transport ATPase
MIDAPALAQAEVGVAMRASGAGADVGIKAASTPQRQRHAPVSG